MKRESFCTEDIRKSRSSSLFCTLSGSMERLWQGKMYYPLLIAVTLGAVILHEAVWGAALLNTFGIWMLLLCPDVMAGLSPICIMTLLTTQHIEDMIMFLPCAPLLALAVLALLIHLRRWPLQLRVGRSGRGLLLVSLATAMGGLGTMPFKEAIKLLSLYYSLGLGAGMLIFYLLTRSQLAKDGGEGSLVRFAGLYYSMGMGAAAIILWTYIETWNPAYSYHIVPGLMWRNFVATILLTTLPIPFGFSLKNRKHLISAAVMVLALVATGSRSALVFGVINLTLCCFYLARWKVISRRSLTVLLILGAAAVLIFGGSIAHIALGSRVFSGERLSGDVTRVKLIIRGIKDFLHHPLFGIGLGNTANSDLFSGVGGSMVFYHNLPIQIIGSMGLMGVLSYGVLFHDRAFLLRGGKNPWADMMGLCYLGMIMISMVNPGQFCPFPNAVMIAVSFSAVEEAVGDPALSLSDLAARCRRICTSPLRPALHK